MTPKQAIAELNSEAPDGIAFQIDNVVAGRVYGVVFIDGEQFNFRLDGGK